MVGIAPSSGHANRTNRGSTLLRESEIPEIPEIRGSSFALGMGDEITSNKSKIDKQDSIKPGKACKREVICALRLVS
jgi:hypothetical protein